MFPRQIGYPLSFRGQVCGTQRSLPCFSSMGLNAWQLPSLQRVPVSPVPRLPRYYEAATTSRRACPSAYVFTSGFHMPWCFVFACALPMLAKSVIGPGALFRPVLRAGFPCGHERDLSGFLVTHPVPLPCSETPAEPVSLTIAAFPVLPPDPTRRRLQHDHDFEACHRASVPAVYASRAMLPSPMQDSLPAGGLRLCREGVEPSGSR